MDTIQLVAPFSIRELSSVRTSRAPDPGARALSLLAQNMSELIINTTYDSELVSTYGVLQMLLTDLIIT